MTPTATLPAVPEQHEIEQKILTLSDRAMQIKVTDDATLLIADSVRSECLAMRKTVETFFKPLKQAAHDAHKKLTAAEAAELSKIVPGENHIKQEMAAYQLDQKKKREAEEARLRKEAEEREEAERLERAAEIEREAAKLQAAGQVEEAAAVQQEAVQVMNTPTYVPPPRVAPAPKTKNAMRMVVDRERLTTITAMLDKNPKSTPPSIPGVRFFQTWNFEVFNASAVPDAYRKPS